MYIVIFIVREILCILGGLYMKYCPMADRLAAYMEVRKQFEMFTVITMVTHIIFGQLL